MLEFVQVIGNNVAMVAFVFIIMALHTWKVVVRSSFFVFFMDYVSLASKRTQPHFSNSFFHCSPPMADPLVALAAAKLESNELHRAAYEGNLEEVERLVKEGKIDINARDKHGNSPLALAIHFKKNTVVKYLLDHGADPTLKSKSGWAPIREALSSGSDETVRLVYRAMQLSMLQSLEKRLVNLKRGLAAVC